MFFSWKRQRLPTLIHFTHAKAGSTWIDGILRVLFGRRVCPRAWGVPDFAGGPGRVFPSVFMRRDEALAIPEVSAARRFFVLRDLRDTLVSRYFSIRESHTPDPAGKIERERKILRALSVEDGLLHCMAEVGMVSTADIQRSWLGSEEIVLRYEDLIARDVPLFTELLVERLGLPVVAEKIAAAVTAQRFENVYQRKLGEEDMSSHGRKGVPGDWKNHFTPRVTEEFEKLYGPVLVAAGYA
jgi:lipopolysaccharide transport system ATP-binding protein